MGSVYSFKNVQAAISGPGGSINLGEGSGSSDEGIAITPSNEISTMQVGADGFGQHSLHADQSGKVVVRLLKTSPTNQLLSAMYNAQTGNAASHGQNTVTIVDTLRGDNVACTQVAFSRAPNLSYGKEAGLVEWEFMAVKIIRTIGA